MGGEQPSLLAAKRSALEERRRPAADFEVPGSAIEDDDGEEEEEEEEEDEFHAGGNEDEDAGGPTSPLLPIFSAAHLDALPVYDLTHTIRLLVIPRCETTLSWDQLRSPQVSQFLVKPIQQQIRTSHFSRATLYALMANCLQFNKEAQLHPGNSGASKTRAMVCELLAIKLLKEFSTRELIGMFDCHAYRLAMQMLIGIDALSYDFYPLQGQRQAGNGNATPNPNWDISQKAWAQSRVARISTLEIAIRAQAKRLLAHPLVVQQLEAIWAGSIVFHSTADNLHRPTIKTTPNQNRGYGAIDSRTPVLQASPDRLQPAKQRDHCEPLVVVVRRSVTLYDPRDASLFKLSRLRVPRYRQALSTCSFAVLLGLFLAVLIERSLDISSLEVIFWFWSAGFMLDEIVGFNEQGFSLYILSFWNAFDLGILLLLICYYGMRLYGLLIPTIRKHHVAQMAYDVLAANAVLLFPRLFSVLDHYRYFSQLLIAFRMMAMDLVAVFILIVISCSGFFVAFTLSFSEDGYDAAGVAYALFQMLMGFTPAAWDSWGQYNLLGKVILTLFLFICHFLIVTILITVLTNSFMAIVQNANEEHQFVFAINAISMVKSDALFSYVAPTNIVAWVLTPLRYILPFSRFVKINRLVIKITHFPILFVIYAYERLVLRRAVFDPADFVEERGRSAEQLRAFEAPGAGLHLFSPKIDRLREPSVATFHKDRALAEVFRRPFRDNTVRDSNKSHARRKTSNVVKHWMQNMGPDGTASPPAEQDRSVVDRLETPKLSRRRSQLLRRRQGAAARDLVTNARSIASDPQELAGNSVIKRPVRRREDIADFTMSMDGMPQQTEDGYGDDELITNDEDENLTLDLRNTMTSGSQQDLADRDSLQEEHFEQTPTDRFRMPRPPPLVPPQAHAKAQSTLENPVAQPEMLQRSVRHSHGRNVSTNTVLYHPRDKSAGSSSSPSRNAITARNSVKNAGANDGANSPIPAGRRTPKRVALGAVRARPIIPPRGAFQSTPNLAGMLMLNTDPRNQWPQSLGLELGSDIGDNKAAGGGFVGAIPSSFHTQMAFASNARRARRAGASEDDDQGRMGRLMLARMNTLEEGFRDILKAVKDSKDRGDRPRSAGNDGQGTPGQRLTAKRSIRPQKKEVVEAEDERVDEAELKGERGSSI